MNDDIQQVVVLGREGLAREHLVDALTALGVPPAWVGHPAQTSPEALIQLMPNKIVISLDSVIEHELEPFSDFFSQSSCMVLYDDAETTARLSGWDLNRWARHLAAKLLGHHIFPVSPASTEFQSSIPATEHRIQTPYEPVAESTLQNVPARQVFSTEHEADEFRFDIDSEEMMAALRRIDEGLARASNAAADDEANIFTFVDDTEPGPATQPASDPDVAAPEILAAHSTDQAMLQMTIAGTDFTSLSLSNESAEAAVERSGAFVSREFDVSKFSLVDEMPAGVDSVRPRVGEVDPIPVSMPPEPALNRLYLVISGLGGPAAVRTLLQQVDRAFSGVMVISLQIGADQLDRLREQLQKITSAELCIAGREPFLRAGSIYLLPPEHGLVAAQDGYQCQPGVGLDAFIARQHDDVRILVLSGTSPALASVLMDFHAARHALHVQEPDDCYDAEVVRTLADSGVPVISDVIMQNWFT